MKPEKIEYFVFDLDGTLCNTLDDLGNSVNKVLAEENLPTHEIEEYKYFVGNGMRMLITRALPEDKRDEEYISELLGRFFKALKNTETRPYDGISEAVTELRKRGIKLGVVTNKAHDLAAEIIQRFFGDSFDIVMGNTSEYPLKPAPDATWEVMRRLGASKENTVFVGDSRVDMITAKNAGLFAVGVLWGYRTAEELKENGADILISSPKQFLNLL